MCVCVCARCNGDFFLDSSQQTPRHVFAVCVCVCVLAGKGKVKAGKGRPLKGGGDPADEPMSPVDVASVASGRGMGGSAPATPTEAETATNQSATGSWSRNSLRGSKCNFSDFLPHLSLSLSLVVTRTTQHRKKNGFIFIFFFCVLSDFWGHATVNAPCTQSSAGTMGHLSG